MTYHRISWHPEVTPFNTAICDDCGGLIPTVEQELHDAREAKINALLQPSQVAEEPPVTTPNAPEDAPKPRSARAKKDEGDG